MVGDSEGAYEEEKVGNEAKAQGNAKAKLFRRTIIMDPLCQSPSDAIGKDSNPRQESIMSD
jgi:hypothetical protein